MQNSYSKFAAYNNRIKFKKLWDGRSFDIVNILAEIPYNRIPYVGIDQV